MSIRLPDEELKKAILSAAKDGKQRECWASLIVEHGFVSGERAVETAVLKNVVEWGDEICPHEVDTLPRFLRRECPECWQDFSREVERK